MEATLQRLHNYVRRGGVPAKWLVGGGTVVSQERMDTIPREIWKANCGLYEATLEYLKGNLDVFQDLFTPRDPPPRQEGTRHVEYAKLDAIASVLNIHIVCFEKRYGSTDFNLIIEGDRANPRFMVLVRHHQTRYDLLRPLRHFNDSVSAALRQALEAAVAQGDVAVARQLLEKGAPPSAAALEAVAARGDVTMARLLLEKGAWSEAAVETALRGEHTETVRLLLEKGATPPAAPAAVLDRRARHRLTKEIQRFPPGFSAVETEDRNEREHTVVVRKGAKKWEFVLKSTYPFGVVHRVVDGKKIPIHEWARTSKLIDFCLD